MFKSLYPSRDFNGKISRNEIREKVLEIYLQLHPYNPENFERNIFSLGPITRIVNSYVGFVKAEN